MNVRFGNHRVNECHLIRALREMRHQIAHPLAAFAILPPCPWTLHTWARVALEQLHFPTRIKLLPMPLNQSGFVIERVALARRPGHKKLHHPLCFCRMMNAISQNSPCTLFAPVISAPPISAPEPRHLFRRQIATKIPAAKMGGSPFEAELQRRNMSDFESMPLLKLKNQRTAKQKRDSRARPREQKFTSGSVFRLSLPTDAIQVRVPAASFLLCRS